MLGRVLGPWGLRGAVRVQVHAESRAVFSPGKLVVLRGPRGSSEVRLTAVRPLRHLLAATFQGIDSRTAAEAVRGFEICIPRTAAPVLPEATYYHHDILGLTVQTEAGERLGEIVDIWPSAAHDLYVVRRDTGEWLLPAVRAFILRVDLPRRVMVVRPIEGLVDAETV
ncbi:MAG TPA: ribosome maturation factor RimM [Candidatus Methylomirabilis sp.]|nr:ribosome maturation factor RimM [Candidatus Methylomirabilis sp.]